MYSCCYLIVYYIVWYCIISYYSILCSASQDVWAFGIIAWEAYHGKQAASANKTNNQ